MDDYKRGLNDMLELLTETDERGAVKLMYRESFDLLTSTSIDRSLIKIALEYRNELAERAKLDEAVKLLESNGYLVSPAHLITEYEKAAEYLRKGGYTVIGPPPPATNGRIATPIERAT